MSEDIRPDKEYVRWLREPGMAEHLAERCDLSGGQIENVARRYTVEHILHGTPLTLEGILELCRAERIDERPLTASQHPIGFRGAGVKQ